jgi:Protein O-mannosyl-transferase TMEM260-like
MTDPLAPPTRSRPPYLLALGTGLVVFAIYLATLAPTTAFWDTSEYIAAAKVLGIPHPPGNPLFVLLAHTFGLLPLAASYAVRINLFAAVTSAASAGLWFLVAERWLTTIVPERLPRLVAAFAGVLVGATMWTVWNQSTVNEKVYTVSLFFMALVTWLAVHWGDDQAGSHRDRWLILIAYLLALTSTVHMMGVLAAPAVVVYVLWTDWRVLTRPWVLAGIVVAVIIGLTPNYIFLPIRSAQFPPINEGEPTGLNAICALTAGLANCSHQLSDVINRVQYGKGSIFDRQADLPAQLANYWQYFSWQFARDWGGFARVATALFSVLGLAGLVELIRRDKRAGFAAAAMLFTLTLALIFYLNFKYGYSIYPDRTDITSAMREVRERDYFFVCSFAFFGTMVALGFGWAMRMVAESVKGGGKRRWLYGLPVAVLALIPLLGNRQTASRAHEWAADAFARDLLQSVEPYGIIITAGDNDTFPLWFAQEVERVRPDVTVANLSLMNTDWHLRQLRRRQAPPFDPSKSIDLWKPGTDLPPADTIPLSPNDSAQRKPAHWVEPTTPVFSLTTAQLDSLPEITRAPQGKVRFGDVEVTFGTDLLDRKDLAVMLLIRDNLGKRPIYFSWSVGTYPDQTFGLTPYLVTQGFVRKLYPEKVVPKPPIVLSAGMGYMDLDRTKALLWDAYAYDKAGRARPHGWVDNPSQSIIELYGVVYAGVAATLRQQGDTAGAARADSVARAVAGSLAPEGGQTAPFLH